MMMMMILLMMMILETSWRWAEQSWKNCESNQNLLAKELKPPPDSRHLVQYPAHNSKAHFTLGVKANVQTQIKHSYWCKKLKSAPQVLFTLGVKSDIEEIYFQSAPSLLINAELYGLGLGPKAE